jgi:hypothetical protein
MKRLKTIEPERKYIGNLIPYGSSLRLSCLKERTDLPAKKRINIE